jgi:hypothetical protein
VFVQPHRKQLLNVRAKPIQRLRSRTGLVIQRRWELLPPTVACLDGAMIV